MILLRAVNVGNATLPMAWLRDTARELGAFDPRTYIASGNLVADVPGDPDAFDRALEQAIEAEHGFFREAVSRSPGEVEAALRAHPFDVVEPRYSYVTFLLRAPAPEAIEKARTFPVGQDRWDVIGREMHIRYVGGAGRPQMSSDAIGRALAVPGTARNLNTVRRLVAMTTS